MKRAFYSFLAFLLCFSAAGCQNTDQEADIISKSAYQGVNTAYELTERFGSNLYDARRAALYDDGELAEEGIASLASEVSLSEEELGLGAACAAVEPIGMSFSEEKKRPSENYSDYE